MKDTITTPFRNFFPSRLSDFGFLLFLFAGIVGVQAAPMIVADGEGRAEIVIAEEAGRTTRLAAQELQDGVRKITGTRLPITFEPTDSAVQLYVGESQWTRDLGITAEGLKAGAYRIASGKNWMVFIGDDSLFEPIEPWARAHRDNRSGKLQREWEEASGTIWGVPNTTFYKHRWRRIPAEMGLPDSAEVDPETTLTIWDFDEHGSFNAVCGWLRSLGMRWYMPGEIGEIVPEMASIPLKPVDKTVFPDFPFRRVMIQSSLVGDDAALWARRLANRPRIDIMHLHGLEKMTNRQEVFDKYPEFFAVRKGKREFDPDGLNHLCYSNPELVEAAADYARALFDVYNYYDAVSIMPADGFVMCECELCKGKESPELGHLGMHSNYVWEFVNEVAKRVAETHPDKYIHNGAYNRYREPPSTIEKLEPNLLVCVVGARQPTHNKPEQVKERTVRNEGWYEKTDNLIFTYQSGPSTGRGFYVPAFVATSIGESVNALKGHSMGEDMWLTASNDFATEDIGFNHFLVYFTMRMHWGGKDADVREMLVEYCDLFYGPAGDTMLEFFDYCEANWQEMEKEKEKTDRALQLFDQALASVQPGTIYAERLAVIDDYLQMLRQRSAQLGRKRGPIPTLRLVYHWDGPIELDGVLDEDEWVNNPDPKGLREMQSGRHPTFPTRVMAVWIRQGLYIAVRCEEPQGYPLNVTTTEDDDPTILEGDAVQFLIETEARSFYQIVVNPAGAVIDFDRSASGSAVTRWSSQVEVATHVADDHWTIEMYIPVIDDESDPFHQVIGRKPQERMPWFINIIRQRVRPNGTEYSAFSPPGSLDAYDLMHFGRIYDGRHSIYDAAEPEYGFMQAMDRADRLARKKQHDTAIEVLIEQVEGEITEYQRSLALAEAARYARAAGQTERADELQQQIPIDAVKHTVGMEQLLADGKVDVVIARFGDADIASWPFWQRGAAYRLRASARAETGDASGAIDDYRESLIWTSDVRERESVQYQIGGLLQHEFERVDEALEVYYTIVGDNRDISGYYPWMATLAIAGIESERGNTEAALAVLERTNPEQVKGSWHERLMNARKEILESAE